MSGGALIGWSGLIGSTLMRQRTFDFCFRSTDIGDIAGRAFDFVICAGARAEKWRANQDPASDLAAISRLTGALERCRIQRMVIVSTIDVYPHPVGVDETTPIDPAEAQPYGKHRYALEQFARERWPTTVIRLPAVFGTGLKKNAVFDLLHDHRVDHVDPRAAYQFYDLRSLSADIDVAVARDIGVMNLVTEPLTMGEVAELVFNRRLSGAGAAGDAPKYDVRTIHCGLFGRSDGYVMGRADTLQALRAFVAAEQGTR